MAVNIGPKIGIDGAAQYKQEITKLTQQTKTFGAEMKALKAEFEAGNKSIEQNRAIREKMGQQIDAQKKKIEALNGQLEKEIEAGNETSKSTLKLQEDIAKATTALTAMESELKAMPSDLELVGQKFEEVGSKVSKVGSGISSFGDAWTKGITAPITAVGAASVMAFKEVDTAMDTLVTKTGATGAALEGMQDTVEGIATTIPTSFQEAADAVGEVNTRFNVTGQELEDISTQFVEFAQINNTDVSSSIDSVQASMAAWAVQTKDTSLYLDTLTKVSQDTGVSTDSLSQALQTNAATLQEMNFSVSDSAIMLGNLEKNGVDTTAAMTGLKKAYAESIKSGTDMSTMLSDLEARLQNGATQADAEAEALSLFGTKAGPQLISALESGRMSFDALNTSMSDFAGTVDSTFNETLDPMDQMQSTMNELKLVGADLVTTAGPMLTDMMKGLGDVVHTLADAWNGLDEGQQETIIKMAAVAAAVGPIASGTGRLVTGIGNVISIGSKIAPLIGTAATALGPLLAAAGPFLIGGAVIAGVIAGGVAIYKNWDTIKEKLGELKEHFMEKWNGMKEKAGEASDFIKDIGSRRISEVKQAFEENGGGIRGTMAATWEVLTTQFKTGFDIMDKITGGKLTEIKDAFFNRFNELKDEALNWGKDLIQNLVNGITSKIGDVKGAVNGVGNAIKGRLHFSEPDVGPLSDFHTWMPDMMKGLSDGMLNNLGMVEDAATQVAGAIAQPVSNNNYGGFSFVINAAPGQSAEEIAEIVEARIADSIERQEGAWA